MYGDSPYYTPEQIQVTAQRLGLDLAYICLAYATFMPESEYAKIISSLPVALGFEEARALFEQYRTHGSLTTTSYVDGGGGWGDPSFDNGSGGGDAGGGGGGGGGDSD
jgi:hypothetical protein